MLVSESVDRGITGELAATFIGRKQTQMLDKFSVQRIRLEGGDRRYSAVHPKKIIVSFVLISPFISSSSLWHISLLFTCHTPPFPRMTRVDLTDHPSSESAGYRGCRCSLDPTPGRLQRPSGEHRTGFMLLNLPTGMFHKKTAGKSVGAKRKVRRLK